MNLVRYARIPGVLAALPILLAIVLAAACTTAQPPLQLAPSVELEKMYGGWFIVANIPNRFEDSLVGLYDVYSARDDGDIREDFYTYKGNFEGVRKHYTVHDWVVPGTHNAAWRVQIFWPVHFPFQILYVDPDYQYALFGYPDRTLGWIYSRTPKLDDATYRSLLVHFQENGFDISRFRRIVQFPDQFGQPGFLPQAPVPGS